jgi:hypothetical protein
VRTAGSVLTRPKSVIGLVAVNAFRASGLDYPRDCVHRSRPRSVEAAAVEKQVEAMLTSVQVFAALQFGGTHCATVFVAAHVSLCAALVGRDGHTSARQFLGAAPTQTVSRTFRVSCWRY